MHIPPHLLNEHYDDRYFDVIDAIEEAKHVFFNGCDLDKTLLSSRAPEKEFRIGETGFGAGRILVALLDVMEKSGVTGRAISYNSVELHPLSPDRMASILEGFRHSAGTSVDLVVREYRRFDMTIPGWHTAKFAGPYGTLILNLWTGEALEMVEVLDLPCDAWFLDGHGPNKNPAMWRPELLTAIGKKTATGGTCATYTVAGAVRRALGSAGFAVERVQGIGWKRLVLKGVKEEDAAGC